MLVECVRQCDARTGARTFDVKALFPGVTYELSEEAATPLIESGDVRVVTAATGTSSATGRPSDDQQGGAPPPLDLAAMKVADLRAIAAERGVELLATAKSKAAIIEAIEAAAIQQDAAE